ncbi:MAG TPA: DDE-type integrase/transposase/recombinase [Methylocella sp.]|jgi:transposase InsO family protein|nr:DDE-type integrase/transposase/recombinase [Methylocella sp.]
MAREQRRPRAEIVDERAISAQMIAGGRRGQSTKRGTGWEALHVAIDDAARLAYTEILPDETKESAICVLKNALAFFARHGITVERITSDNGSAYKSHVFRDHLKEAGLRHPRTRPYTPKTNGKAERFIQTSLRKWIYAVPLSIFRRTSQRHETMDRRL